MSVRSGLTVRLAALAATTILACGVAAPVFAQSPHPNLDANGVDLTDGTFSLRLPVASIGSGQAELALVARGGQEDNWSGIQLSQTVSGGLVRYAVSLGFHTDDFTSAGPASLRGTGATLTQSGGNMVYRGLDGTEIVFSNPAGTYGGSSNLCDANNSGNCSLLPATMSGRSGMTVTFGWDIEPHCTDVPIDDPRGADCVFNWRLASVTNVAGYGLFWSFVGGAGLNWITRTSVALRNGTTTVGTVMYGNAGGNVATLTTPGGKVWRIGGQGNLVTGVRRPGEASDYLTVVRSGSQVTSVTRDGVTTGYNRTVSGNSATMTVTDAASHTSVVVSDVATFRPVSVTDALGRTTAMAHDAAGRLAEVTHPEGDRVQLAYDTRGNLTERRLKAKPTVGGADIVTSAGYPASCVDAACNSPVWTRDARGNRTDYAYDPATGLPTVVTGPAPTPGAVRPETRYSYAVVSGTHVVSEVSTCRTGAAPRCVGTADETRRTLAWDANLNLVSATVAAGDGSVSATTAASYDLAGDAVAVDGPLAGAGDVTRAAYTADREPAWSMAPDPDGAGPRRAAATRTVRDAAGRAVSAERGSVPSGAVDWSGFVGAAAVEYARDGHGRVVGETLVAGGAALARTAYGYDALGRAGCTAVRMDPAQWNGQADACLPQTTGPHGPDRVSRLGYDALGRVVSVTRAAGTAAASVEETGYTVGGQVAWVEDGEDNRTVYGHDGHDRLVRTTYPGGAYEEAGLDAGGNVVSRRLRDGQVLGYTYDALGRRVSDDHPNAGVGDVDASYAYDLEGRVVYAGDSDGWWVRWSYDALGRTVRQWSGLSSTTLAYDAAGRRTRQTWADGFFATYERDAAGLLTAVRENGGLALATYAYDDLGRRTGVTRGNGTVTSYAYDAGSRLTGLTHNLAGGSWDLALGFTHNPAGQVASRTSSNDGYAFTGHYDVDRPYTANALNQYASAGPASFGYDGRGNLTGDGSRFYRYNTRDQLSGDGGALHFHRDPVGLLTHAVTRNLDHVGPDLASEFDSNTGALRHRYVHGDGVDEPLVWYDGGTRRYLHADERGSVIAVSDDAGAATAINRYDEYGIPAATNVGRFQYTGQKWIPELGLYDYKARMYSPTLGRFMQADPIGYGDGLNLYGYVGGDPVNATDPTGLCQDPNAPDVQNDRTCDVPVAGKRLLPPVPEGAGNEAAGYVRAAAPNLAAGQGGEIDDQQEEKQVGSDVVVTAQRILPRIGPPPTILARPPIFNPTIRFPGLRNVRPGPGWEWRGPPDKGAWYNPKTGESLRPDFKHPAPIRPHWDYKGPNGQWRWYGPGDAQLKAMPAMFV